MENIISEIADAAQEKAPPPTESSIPLSAGPEIKPPGASHKAGDVTRKPGETRGRKTNAQREQEAEAEKAKTLEQEMRDAKQQGLDYAMTGQQIADGFAYTNVVFFGPEFNFTQFKDAQGNIIKDERQEFYKVGGDMAEQYNWRRLPPWIQIALIMVSYYGIRAAMPPVRQKFGGWFKGAWVWVAKKLSRKPVSAPVPAPPAK